MTINSQAFTAVNEKVVFSKSNTYRFISLRDKVYIRDWLESLFVDYYPQLVKGTCFESMELYFMDLLQNEDSFIVKTKYKATDVVFMFLDFPYLKGMVEVKLVHLIFQQLKLIKADFQLPVIPCIIFQTERDYEVVSSLLNQLPYETALLINYLSFVYEE